ncbi:hypothetical protein Ae201684P_022427 [Aphanomyces euteiches]|nr:hypothetical protein Ae201684P_022427 [Aphanomyces euteiches]
MGPNTYKIGIPTHPDKIVTVNVDRLKPFKGYYSRPFNEEVPEDESPLDDFTIDCLPRSSFIDRVDYSDGDVAYSSVDSPIHKICDKRRLPNSREPEYLVEHVDGYKYWTQASKLSEYRSYIDNFERKWKKGCLLCGDPRDLSTWTKKLSLWTSTTKVPYTTTLSLAPTTSRYLGLWP